MDACTHNGCRSTKPANDQGDDAFAQHHLERAEARRGVWLRSKGWFGIMSCKTDTIINRKWRERERIESKNRRETAELFKQVVQMSEASSRIVVNAFDRLIATAYHRKPNTNLSRGETAAGET
jgi:hypothetical protein